MDTVVWTAGGGAALLYAALVPFSSMVRLGLAGLGILAILIGVRVSIAYRERLARIKRAGHSPSAWTGLGSGKV